jgi:hypothetical protein
MQGWYYHISNEKSVVNFLDNLLFFNYEFSIAYIKK